MTHMGTIADLKSRLADVPGIENLVMRFDPNSRRAVFEFGGLVASTDPLASDQEIEDAIRAATRLPSVALIPDKPQEVAPMTTPAPGSFAASLKAMMDEARDGVLQARADGHARVGAAIGKLNDVKAATVHVTAKMAQTIEDEAADGLAELGQISNDLGI